jgi:aryl-alcohol dehydrogenase-like predicted oxidoreductase
MGKGLLTGGFDLARASSLSADDHRSRDPRFQSPQLEINLEFVEGLNRIATELGWTVAELAIAWVLRRSEVTSAIVGARRPEQIEQTAIAGTRVMSDDSTSEIQHLLSRRSEALDSLDGIEQARV